MMRRSDSFGRGKPELNLALGIDEELVKLLSKILKVDSKFVDKDVEEVSVKPCSETLVTFAEFTGSSGECIKMKGRDLELTAVEILLSSSTSDKRIVICPQVDSSYSKKYFLEAGFTEEGLRMVTKIIASMLKRDMTLYSDDSSEEIEKFTDDEFIEVLNSLTKKN